MRLRALFVAAGFLILFAVLSCNTGAGAGGGTQHYVIGTGVDDGSQREGYDIDATGRVAIENQSAISSERQSPMFRFENVQLDQGQTVTGATVTIYNDFGYYVGADWQIQGGCSDLQVVPDIYGRPVLPVSVPWYATIPRRGLVTSPNLASLFDALTAQPSWRKGDSACLILRADDENYRPTGGTGFQVGFDPRTFESGFPATLDVVPGT